jgi:hypothetical protein
MWGAPNWRSSAVPEDTLLRSRADAREELRNGAAPVPSLSRVRHYFVLNNAKIVVAPSVAVMVTR